MIYKVIDTFIFGVTAMFMVGMFFKIPKTIINEFKNIRHNSKLSLVFFIISIFFLILSFNYNVVLGYILKILLTTSKLFATFVIIGMLLIWLESPYAEKINFIYPNIENIYLIIYSYSALIIIIVFIYDYFTGGLL